MGYCTSGFILSWDESLAIDKGNGKNPMS